MAAGAFGLSLYVLAQAAVNLKAAADQALIGTADSGVRALYYVVPAHDHVADDRRPAGRATSPGAAAPRVEINHNIVLVPAAGWGSVRLDARLVRPARRALRQRPAPAPAPLTRR